jgi:hypothetical protein
MSVLPVEAAQASSSSSSVGGIQFVVPDTTTFIIVLSRDITDSELALLREYGKVVIFDHRVYTNIVLQAIDFDYFLLDLRKSEDRQYLQQIPINTLEKYNLVSLCHSVQKGEGYHEELGVDNVLTKLPPKQAFKPEFDRMLLQKKISKPNAGVSCIKSVFRLFNGQWN